MKTESFDAIYHRALERKGSDKMLMTLIGPTKDQKSYLNKTDSQFLEEFTKKVFQSGFVWRVVEQKWDGFREVFFDFDIEKVLLMPPDMVERKAQDERIIRNYKKVQTIQENALMINSAKQTHGGFAQLVEALANENVITLWQYLKKHGARLGGNTGPYALRALGVDTFLLTRDIEGYMRAQQVIDGGLTSKKSLQAIQAYYDRLQAESGWSYQALNRLIAYSFGDNVVGIQ
ncbi:DNA-3-methyladenine glycosylase I [Flocculibacter collagenilyticus]|uniref:DNA-3-methyladenine glycosylase I n=1 Tax=Flocculibacter collagenilyticus TaxID=2744479 RepID=UPI0018F3EEBE|nr:DNA-3-methyladenine glycosylase I [Flocculibacter collagenilyticus]